MMLLGKITPADLQIKKTSNCTVTDVGCPLPIPFVTIISKSQEAQLKFQSGERLPSERRLAASKQAQRQEQEVERWHLHPKLKAERAKEKERKAIQSQNPSPVKHFLQQKYPQKNITSWAPQNAQQ